MLWVVVLVLKEKLRFAQVARVNAKLIRQSVSQAEGPRQVRRASVHRRIFALHCTVLHHRIPDSGELIGPQRTLGLNWPGF